MANYSSETLITDEIGLESLISLTDDDGAGSVGSAELTRQLNKADAKVNSYVEMRYPQQVPFTTVPEEIQEIATNLAIFYLYRRRNLVTDQIRQNYEDAMDWLKNIAAGKAAIEGLEIPANDQTQDDTVNITYQTAKFKREDMDGF